MLAFSVLVWPGRYRYDQLRMGNNTYPVRIDRLTGHAALLDGESWVPVRDSERSSSADSAKSLPAAEVAKLTGTASAPMGTMYLNLYNGSSSWRVTEIQVAVIGKGAAGNTLWRRSYKTSADIGPLASGIASFTFTEDPAMKRFDWSFESVKGHQDH